MNRKQRRAQAAKMRKELNRQQEIRQELLDDNVTRIAMELGCTILHLDKDADDITTLRIFKDE